MTWNSKECRHGIALHPPLSPYVRPPSPIPHFPDKESQNSPAWIQVVTKPLSLSGDQLHFQTIIAKLCHSIFQRQITLDSPCPRCLRSAIDVTISFACKNDHEGQNPNLSHIWGKFMKLTTPWHILTMTKAKTKTGENFHEESVYVYILLCVAMYPYRQIGE